jgi:antiviral helicase SLH1
MVHSDSLDDPGLSAKRRHLVIAAAKELVKARMITFNETNETFTITERGQIAARYYVRYQSVEIFNKEMRPMMTEADVLRLISKSTEVWVSIHCTFLLLTGALVRTITTPRS